MKILLVLPSDEHSISSDIMKNVQRGVGFLPPLGLFSLAAWIIEHTGWEAEVRDCCLEGVSAADGAAAAADGGFDAVGLCCLSHGWPEVWRWAEALKKLEKPPLVIAGGPHASLFPAELLSHRCIDYAVLGEGEEPLQQLLELWGGLSSEERRKVLDRNRALWLKSAEGAAGTAGYDSPLPSAERIPAVMRFGDSLKTPYVFANLNVLPFARRDLGRYSEYLTVVSRKSCTTTITASRGCPYACRFCWTAGGKHPRQFSPEHVCAEMEQSVNLGIEEFFFFDELFTYSRDWVEAFCRLLIKRGLPVSWDVRSRADTVSADMLKLMHSAGCHRVQYGFEAGTARVLKALGKGITLEQSRSAASWTQAAGMASYADFMLGAPDETLEEMEETIAFAKDLHLDYAHFAVIMLYPRTRFYKEALADGFLADDVWQAYAAAPEPDDDFQIPYASRLFSREVLEAKAAEAYRRICFTPEYIWRRIKGLSSWNELKMGAAAAWGLLVGNRGR